MHRRKISDLQSEMVPLQAKADSTQAEMLEVSASVARLLGRSAEMAAERARTLDAQSGLELVCKVSGVSYARKCIGDVLAGSHDYSNQLSEVQQLWQQLVVALDVVRPLEPDPRQQTLYTAIARQAPTTPSMSVGAVQAPVYDMTTPPKPQSPPDFWVSPARLFRGTSTPASI